MIGQNVKFTILRRLKKLENNISISFWHYFVQKKVGIVFEIVVVFSAYMYRTRAIITRGLYTFYPLFEVHLCTVTFGLMYG